MKIADSLLFVAFVFGAATLLPAQVDAEHSIARFSLGSGPSAVEVGMGSVSGDVVFDASDATNPIVNLWIKPDESPGADYSEISFKSKRSTVTNDGELAVVGDLSLVRVERGVSLDPTEGYYGASHGEPVIHTDTREVTLLLPSAIRPAVQSGAMQLSASINVSRERFPQLLAALRPGNWPSMVLEGEKCTMPSSVGEDYSGAICTGKPVATALNSVAQGTAGGEGYYGFEPAMVPTGGQATIALNLTLTQVTSAPSAASVMTRAARN